MSKPINVHRPSEFERVKQTVLGFDKGVTIIGINGYGGVGKIYLLESVMEEVDLASEKVLLLRTDGSNDDFAAIFEHENSVAPRHLPPPAAPAYDYFSHTHEVINCYRNLSSQLVEDIMKATSEDLDAEAIKSQVNGLIKLGVAINELMPKTKEFFDTSKLSGKHSHINQVVDTVVAGSKALKKTKLPGFLKHLSKQSLKDKVTNNFHSAISEAMVTDLSAAILGYQKKDTLKPTKRSIPNVERLMIVFDDFEITKDVLADFLIDDFMPALQQANFPTLFVILGRDDLEASHSNFSRVSRFVKDQIRLEPFSKEDAMAYLEEQKVFGEDAIRLYEDSHGYPFLLRLLLEGRNSKETSALFLQKFYERTTRWMTLYQKEWLLRMCYLDTINLGTIPIVLPDEDTTKVMDWFRHEASVRDPHSDDFTVNPLIRNKILSHHRNIVGEQEHERLCKLGKEIGRG